MRTRETGRPNCLPDGCGVCSKAQTTDNKKYIEYSIGDCIIIVNCSIVWDFDWWRQMRDESTWLDDVSLFGTIQFLTDRE